MKWRCKGYCNLQAKITPKHKKGAMVLSKTYKSIFGYFGVNSHRELLEFIRHKPDDPKTIELKKLISSLDGDSNERKFI